jgi:hypothetical protein
MKQPEQFIYLKNWLAISHFRYFLSKEIENHFPQQSRNVHLPGHKVRQIALQMGT